MYAKDLIKRLSNRTAYVYLDRPNNPTGQTMPLEDVEHIVTTAAQVGAYVLVDEAYGDFIPREESAVMLRNQHDNLLICRTMSKGFGLANLRAGYILSNTVIASYLEHMSHPYILGDMIRETCAVALEQPEFPIAHAEDIAEAKELVCGSIGKCIEMLESDPRVPICTLHLRKSQDFQEILLSQGILAVSGCEFELLDESYVRIRVPMLEAIATLTKALSQIDSDNF